MAKHQVGKTVSKKSRISCKPNASKHPAIIVQAERVANAMHNAFLNIQIAVDHSTKAGSHIVDAILNSAKRNTGNPPAGRGWTANVSVKTLKALQQQGVFG